MMIMKVYINHKTDHYYISMLSCSILTIKMTFWKL